MRCRNKMDVAETNDQNDVIELGTIGISVRKSMLDLEGEEFLGQGNFGVVAKVWMIPRNGYVAIKRIKTNTMAENDPNLDLEFRDNLESELEAKKCLEQEINVLNRLKHHPNLINMIGIVPIDDGGKWLVLEYCDLGNLKEYLMAHKNNLISNENDKNSRWLLRWAYQVANGMSYLAEKGISHGDLAARNIVLQSPQGSDLCPIAKIADFGLADNRFYTYPHRMKETVKRVAWGWAAYEFITYGKIGLKSDIWSFGVLFWEIITFGEIMPYSGLNYSGLDERFQEALQSGLRLECPTRINKVTNWKPLSPEKLYARISKKCFQLDPDKRPDFEGIKEIIEINLSQEEL